MTDYTQLVCAAAAWAGPGSGEQEVVSRAVTLALLCEDDGVAMKRVKQVMDAQRFVGTLERVTIEESSTRGILHLFTGISERHPDGIETVRTERTDSPIGAAMVEQARNLIGHRLLVFKINEPIKGRDANVRLCVHLLDLGVSDDKDRPAGAAPAAQPQSAPAPRAAPARPAPVSASAAAPSDADLAALRATIGRLAVPQQGALAAWCTERGFRFAAPDTTEHLQMAHTHARELLAQHGPAPDAPPAAQEAKPAAAKPAGEAPKEQTVKALHTAIGCLGAGQREFLAWCKEKRYRMGRPATEAEATEQYEKALTLVPEDDAVAS